MISRCIDRSAGFVALAHCSDSKQVCFVTIRENDAWTTLLWLWNWKLKELELGDRLYLTGKSCTESKSCITGVSVGGLTSWLNKFNFEH